MSPFYNSRVLFDNSPLAWKFGYIRILPLRFLSSFCKKKKPLLLPLYRLQCLIFIYSVYLSRQYIFCAISKFYKFFIFSSISSYNSNPAFSNTFNKSSYVLLPPKKSQNSFPTKTSFSKSKRPCNVHLW